jgi:TonB family protein
MRGRISKAKALIAVRNYPAAIYELENIRRETSDQIVHGVLNVLLMNCYLEQGDYKRAQDFLGALYKDVTANRAGAPASYYAAAGQVIKGARNQSDRYRSLGLSVSDRNLAPEALGDLEKMRETLELVIEQSKQITKNPKETANAFALLEEAGTVRGVLARDDFDSRRWKDAIADSREMLANSRATVLNATNEPMPETTAPKNTVAMNTPANVPTNTLPVPSVTSETPRPAENNAVFKPVSDTPKPDAQKPVTVEKKAETTAPAETVPAESKPAVESKPQPEVPKSRERRVVGQTAPQTDGGPVNVGSLLEYAVEKKAPVYPSTARTLRQTGVVRLELLIDENGQVAKVQNLSGPALLQSAARDAVVKWRFKPFVRDGQPVKATGFLSFNFNL